MNVPKKFDILVDCCDIIPPFPVLADYFGAENLCNYIILGLYIKMLNSWNIDKNIIEKALLIIN
jgi:hypothetical protein